MTYKYTKPQIRLAKNLVKWLMKQGMVESMARAEVAGLIKAHKYMHLRSAGQDKACHDLKSLKPLLAHKKTLNSKRSKNNTKAKLEVSASTHKERDAK